MQYLYLHLLAPLLLLFQDVDGTASFEVEVNVNVDVKWYNVTMISKTMATLQVVANPILNSKTSPIAATLFQNLHELQADLVRYVPWFPYPQMSVAELEPPDFDKMITSWYFAPELQQELLDTIQAVTTPTSSQDEKKRIVLNFSTQPTWMFNTTDWSYTHNNPNKANWNYPRGNWVNRKTTKLVAGYYARLASWIVEGEFRDEFNTTIKGGPALGLDKITHWEIFNEPEAEHALTPEQYNAMFDAIVRAIRDAVDPAHSIQFMGMALAGHHEWKWWNTFLTPQNHAPDVRDAISNGYATFHWYGKLPSRTNVSTYMEPFGKPMQDFLQEVRDIIQIRNQWSPTTKLNVNEAGVIPVHDNQIGVPELPPIYFNMAAAVYTVLVSELSLLGVDVVGSSQFAGCTKNLLWDIPDRQYPGVSMTNWTTGAGNPRYWALKLYLEYFGPDDKIVHVTNDKEDQVFVQARISVKKQNRHVMRVVNKTDRQQSVFLCNDLVGATVHIVDETTHDGHWKSVMRFTSSVLTLERFAVAVVDTGHESEIEMD